ncbi:MAG: YraN family protein [Gammaproteobacteria bacterium]|nr:YraN family protein [Gammaproteobacteria bacterium]
MKRQSEQGKLAEILAQQLLESHQLKLLEKNYFCRYGEIDLIMQDAKTLVFIEVRFRRSEQFGGAIESIDSKKQGKLRITAQHYMQKHNSKLNARFDVVTLSSLTDKSKVNWIKYAFE